MHTCDVGLRGSELSKAAMRCLKCQMQEVILIGAVHFPMCTHSKIYLYIHLHTYTHILSHIIKLKHKCRIRQLQDQSLNFYNVLKASISSYYKMEFFPPRNQIEYHLPEQFP